MSNIYVKHANLTNRSVYFLVLDKSYIMISYTINHMHKTNHSPFILLIDSCLMVCYQCIEFNPPEADESATIPADEG